MRQFFKIVMILIILVLSLSMQTIAQGTTENGSDAGDVLGHGFLSKIVGLWHGPVSTDTPAGSFPEWHVDFRPVSPGQVSQYSLLDFIIL